MLKTVSSITNAIGALNYKGTWNASTNTPTIVSSVGVKGDYYVVSVAGTTNINGVSNWGVGDWITFNGSVWQRVEGGADLNGVNLSVSGTTTLSNLTASTALALNASKEVVSVTNTGTGNNVLADGPTLTTPTLGVASATSINKVALTAPATGSTLTIADGKTLTANATLTLAGTDGTTQTFPSTSATIARTDAGQTFTGTQVMTSPRIVTSINDTNGNEVLGITATASAVNEFTITNAATGQRPELSATGTDTNISLNISPKGTGIVSIRSLGISYPDSATFMSATASSIGFAWDGTNILSSVDNVLSAVIGTPSDYRLKTNIVLLTDSMQAIMALRPIKYTPVNFDGTVQTEKEHIGLIAHEVKAIRPSVVLGQKDAVNENGQPIYQSVNYAGLVPDLIVAIQELSAKVNTLQTEIAVLKGN